MFRDNGKFKYFDSTSICTVEEKFHKQLEQSIFKTVSRFKHNLNKGDKVAIHSYKRIGPGERRAVERLNKEYNIKVSLLYLDRDTNLEIFDPEKPTCYAHSGLMVHTGGSQAILNTAGHEKAQLRGRSSTQPIWILGEGCTEEFFQNVRDVYYLCYVYWRDQFGASYPITLKYAELIANLIQQAEYLNQNNKLSIEPEKLGTKGKMRQIPWFI